MKLNNDAGHIQSKHNWAVRLDCNHFYFRYYGTPQRKPLNKYPSLLRTIV